MNLNSKVNIEKEFSHLLVHCPHSHRGSRLSWAKAESGVPPGVPRGWHRHVGRLALLSRVHQQAVSEKWSSRTAGVQVGGMPVLQVAVLPTVPKQGPRHDFLKQLGQCTLFG